MISLENLFDEGREETIRELASAFGAIEQFGRFVADDPATVYDPHPRPGSWLHDPKDEKGPDTERGSHSHPRGPWEIKYERRNDSVSAFMALKQIPLFNISRTHTHRPADIGFLASGNVSHGPQPSLPTGLFANISVPVEAIVDDQRQISPGTSIQAKNKAKRMRRGAATAANARSQPAEDFPPLSKMDSKKLPDKEAETGASKAVGAWKAIKNKVPEVPTMERSDVTKFCERVPLDVAESSTEEPIQQPRVKTFKSLEQLIFDSSDSESVRKVENVLGLSADSSHKTETSRKPMKPTTCIEIVSRTKLSGERWDQKHLVGVFSVHQGCLRVDYKGKRKPAGSFVAHVEFENEDQAKAAFEAEKEHLAFGKQMRLVPARRHRDQQLPGVHLQPAPVEIISCNAEQVIGPKVHAERQDETEDLSPALSSTLQAESPRPSTSRTDEMEVVNLPETTPSTPSAHVVSLEEPEQRDRESCVDAMVIEVSETTYDGDDGDNEKDATAIGAENDKVGKDPSEGQGEEVPGEQGHAPGRLVTSVSTPGLLFGGESELGSSKIGHLSQTHPFIHRRALSDSDHPKSDCSLDVTLRETIRLPEDVQSALLRLPRTKFHHPHVPEWCESEIQAASPQPLQQVAFSTGSGSEAIPQPNQASPSTSTSSPVISPTVSPFGALVYIPPPFDSGSTGTSVRHFNSPVPAKGFVETPHGLLPIYPMEVLDRFGRSAPAYYPPQYPILPQPQWSQSQAWQQQQGGQWVWNNYTTANHPYSMPLTPGHIQSVHATVAQQQTSVPPQGLQPVDDGNQPAPSAYPHQMSRNSSGEPHGRRRQLSQRRSRPPGYGDPSPTHNGSQQALSSSHPVNQSYLTPQHNDNSYHQPHSYNLYQAQSIAPQATTEPSFMYPINDLQAQNNLYLQSQSAFNQQHVYSPLPFQLHQQQYQHPPPPFSAAPMYHYSTIQSDPTPVPPTQHSDHTAQPYSVT